MKNPKSYLFALCFLLMILMPLSADLGPKPSVIVDVPGLESECWGTLLSFVPSTGPARAWDGVEGHEYIIEGQEEIWKAFVSYRDPDGYNFLQWVWPCKEDGGFRWGYYPPERFKIALYFPSTGEIKTTRILERYAFDSYFRVDPVSMSVRKDYDINTELLSLFLRIVATILLELAAAYIFRYREKKQIIFISIVNVVTQILLNVALMLLNMRLSLRAFMMCYIGLEAAVFALEALIYALWMEKWSSSEIKKGKTVWYALTANFISFLAGVLIYQLVPGII